MASIGSQEMQTKKEIQLTYKEEIRNGDKRRDNEKNSKRLW